MKTIKVTIQTLIILFGGVVPFISFLIFNIYLPKEIQKDTPWELILFMAFIMCGLALNIVYLANHVCPDFEKWWNSHLKENKK
jgi:RsiW-degrading membrane proteinase PrsW (M82 family)